MPLPVFAETVSSGTPFNCASPSSSAALTPLNSDEAFSATSHLLSARISARPSSITWLAILRSCTSRPAGGVEQQHHDFGIIDRALGVGDRQPLQLVVDLGALPQTRGIDQPHRTAFPFPIEADRIAGDPGFGAGDHPLLPSMRVDQGRLAGVRPPDDGDVQRGVLVVSSPPSSSSPSRSTKRPQRLEQIGDALAMLGADRDRIAKAEAEGFEDPAFARRGPRPCWRRRSPASIRPGASGRSPRRAESGPRGHRP